MKYDFDEIVPRRGTNAIKWDMDTDPEVLPMWVADMNFPSLPTVQEAIHARVNEPHFGYFNLPDAYFDSIIRWQKERNGVEDLPREAIGYENGVLGCVASAAAAFTSPGESILLHSPTYIGFTGVLENCGRNIVLSDLVQDENGVWRMDYADMDRKLKEHNIHFAIFCSPHNPVGRVWTKEELTAIGDLCVQYGVTVVSDEIHGDFIFKGEHQVFTAIKKEYEDITITCTAPSKTFNLASMMMSNIFIANPELRAKFRKQLDAAGTSQLGVMGLVACETAYNKGEEWYEAMLSYVKANAEFTRQYVEEQLPGVKMIDLEGTYLVWLDFRKTGLSVDELEDLMINKAKLWLDSGKIFGDCGRGFQRINIACPRATLTEALERIRDAMKSR